jgi:hypothetical protein
MYVVVLVVVLGRAGARRASAPVDRVHARIDGVFPPTRFVLSAVALVGLLAGCSSGERAGDAERFCGEVKAQTRAIVRPRVRTTEDVDALLALYRQLGEHAPLAIDDDWDALILNYETASTVVPGDPESLQRVAARAYATERSAVAVHDWLLANCAVDIGPVATIVPATTRAHRNAPPTTLAG